MSDIQTDRSGSFQAKGPPVADRQGRRGVVCWNLAGSGVHRGEQWNMSPGGSVLDPSLGNLYLELKGALKTDSGLSRESLPS